MLLNDVSQLMLKNVEMGITYTTYIYSKKIFGNILCKSIIFI